MHSVCIFWYSRKRDRSRPWRYPGDSWWSARRRAPRRPGQASARIVVNTHNRIDPGADEADVRQRLSGIPTGGQPRLVLRPHLEIHHDRVQAAHGATWGAMPEDALFYAAQRGLGEREARALIIEGMARAALARSLDTPELMALLDVDGWLARTVARHLSSPIEPDPPGACHA